MTWLRRSRYRWLQAIARFYVSVFRAVPGVVQIFLAYYGLPEIIPALKTWSPEVMVILALGFKYAAYMAETFRAAVDSVDAGQWEAATSLQINKWAFFKHVMLPQAAVNAIPGFGNYTIGILKETALAFVIGVTELFGEGKLIAGGSFKYMEVYAAVAIIYWLLVVVYSALQNKLERYYRRYM
ncbi:amino acid ABC transporter permease [Weissella cibaria]|uniref:amino acid ABC transporter permease n=1 Tax=Weissella cibaria TaxID=137591 RepID=UPI000AFB8327|nr:amino acid ABC transporter permease [Weissella cibaria]